MAETKRIMICLPTTLLEEVDGIMGIEKKNRSEFIREAMRFYLKEKKKSDLREAMRRGYQEMAQLNLTMAQEAYYCEVEVDILFQHKLVECL